MAGVKDEIETLMGSYEQPLLAYATRLLRNPDLAQDVVQDAFIRYVDQRRDGQSIDNPKAWLYRVTHNLALDFIRKNRRGEAVRDEIRQQVADNTAEGPDQRAARRDAEAVAFAMLETLPEREKQLVLLRLIDGKTYKEMAEIMGLTTGNVGFILHHAMKKLAAKMKDVLA